MKKINLLLFALAIVALSGCSVIGGIFKAGAAVGIISVIVVILIIIWIISAFRGRS
ncbi:MAG: lipoprotein [Bacteroidota bacterium]|nr:lipoprotein [Mucilaginibacter sp. L294]